MAVEVVFYSLAPKPVAVGRKAWEDVAEGKASRGRRWFRLESGPEDVFQFPDGADDCAVRDWVEKNRSLVPSSVAFMLDGELHSIDNGPALSAVSGGGEARNNAMSMQAKGRAGWVVFLPEGREKP